MYKGISITKQKDGFAENPKHQETKSHLRLYRHRTAFSARSDLRSFVLVGVIRIIARNRHGRGPRTRMHLRRRNISIPIRRGVVSIISRIGRDSLVRAVRGRQMSSISGSVTSTISRRAISRMVVRAVASSAVLVLVPLLAAVTV